MDAFNVMKGKADEKDKGWLQNFLTESLVEDIPWECSKALVILKAGYQAIIPREASRGILMGETSYTIIDDNGVEFFLSPKDKKARKDGVHTFGLSDPEPCERQKLCTPMFLKLQFQRPEPCNSNPLLIVIRAPLNL